MLHTMIRRITALLAAGGMLLSSGGAVLAVPWEPPTEQWTSLPDWEPENLPTQPQLEISRIELPQPVLTELAVQPDLPDMQPVRFALRLPENCGSVSLEAPDGGRWVSFGHDTLAVEVPPGEYWLECGDLYASLHINSDGTPVVLGGSAAWDGELLTIGGCGTLELHCHVPRDGLRQIRIEASGERYTRAAGYDPLLDDGSGCEVVYQLTLPVGSVTVTAGSTGQVAAVLPGETTILYF